MSNRDEIKTKLQDHANLWKACEACMIADWAFQKVFFDGSVTPYWLFCGEGPGVSEDALGQPFVGASGRLLREALDLVGFPHIAYALTNLVACRPCDSPRGDNRTPNQTEIENCSDRLRGLIDILKPRILVAVGRVAAVQLSDNYNLPMRSILHPSFILRRGGRKAKEWKDWLLSLNKIKEGAND